MSVVALKRVTEYRAKVLELYNDVRAWLADAGLGSTVEEIPWSVREDPPGEYEVPSLRISMAGRDQVVLEPKGRFIVAALGRIDIASRKGREVLVLLPNVGVDFDDEEDLPESVINLSDCEWIWVESKVKPSKHTLDPDLFLRLLQVLS